MQAAEMSRGRAVAEVVCARKKLGLFTFFRAAFWETVGFEFVFEFE